MPASPIEFPDDAPPDFRPQIEGLDWQPELGSSTAYPKNLAYRIGRISSYLSGHWLDFGCADGGYGEALLAHGVDRLDGVDVDPRRIAEANARGLTTAHFQAVGDTDLLPFPDNTFDGVLMNEVLEHVADDAVAVREAFRVLKPGGVFICISPNRWFPFEGHGAKAGRFNWGRPAPIVPWLPDRMTRFLRTARNYWPYQIVRLHRRAGFRVESKGFIWPVFEVYPWMPKWFMRLYDPTRMDSMRGIRRFGVSSKIISRKP